MNNKVSIISLIILIIIAVFISFTLSSKKEVVVIPEAPTLFTDKVNGISFTYPAEDYLLETINVGNAERKHTAIVLIRKEDSAPRENGEGPTAITFDIYQNNIDKQTLNGWLTGTNASNFKLSSGVVASTTVDGTEAVRYEWSGLYEGTTIAFLHNENVIAYSVTSLTPQDENRKVYEEILKTIKLEAKQ